MKQPRTKCKMNQHQKRGVPVLRVVNINPQSGTVTLEDTGKLVPRNTTADLPFEHISVAEMLRYLGYRTDTSYEWRPK